MAGKSLLDELNARAAAKVVGKAEFGEFMHNPNVSEEDKKAMIDMVNEAGGYENLDD